MQSALLRATGSGSESAFLETTAAHRIVGQGPFEQANLNPTIL